MDKKYFTKYLPVPGEIEKGDLVMDTDGMVHETPDSWIGQKDIIAKQVLCSRDIQVGDKIRCEYPSTLHFDVECLRTYEKSTNVPHWVVRGTDGKEYYYDKNNSFKVIGEVSPAAIWVKEGMEFEENDIQYWLEMSGVWFRFNKPKVNGLVRFKCPTCNTFH